MDDKQKAVYSTIANFHTEEEARENTKEIAKTLLLGSRQVVMFINHALSNPKIKDELLAAGFTEKQLPEWVGSKPIVKADAMDKKATERKATGRKAIQRMKPAGNPSTEGEIPSSQVQPDALRSIPLLSNPLPSNAIQSNEGEAIEQAEVVGQLAVREQDEPKINPTDSDANLTGSSRITRQSMTVITGSEYSLTQHIHV